ncbi:Satratoxin biosynthesis SC4 cluster protein [Paramyrothecium foliicola]|nr:Satratoxin biosynthesis SC4 cluster protein [Paramyrothecium foliicola]
MALPLGAIQLTVISSTTTAFAFISIGLRLWSRRILNMPLAFNDFMALIAMVFASGAVSVFLAAGFAAGLGVHLRDILATEPGKFALHLKLFVPAQLLWAAADTCVKFSILSLYTTIFPGKKFAYICYGTMGLNTAYFVSVLLETFLLCKPVQYSWDKSIPGGKCEGENLAYLIAGITNLVIDAFIVALPMPLLFRLQMSLSRKLSIAGMFSLGILICVISLLRVIWLQSWDLTDMTYTVTPGAIYSILEPTLGVVNASLPTVKPALASIVGRKSFNSTQQATVGSGSSIVTPSRRQQKRASDLLTSYNHDFVKLTDDIPLSDLQLEHEGSIPTEMRNRITVTRRWNINYTSSEGEQSKLPIGNDNVVTSRSDDGFNL